LPTKPIENASQGQIIPMHTVDHPVDAGGQIIGGGLRPVGNVGAVDTREYLIRTHRRHDAKPKGPDGIDLLWLDTTYPDLYTVHAAWIGTTPFYKVHDVALADGSTLTSSNVGNTVLAASRRNGLVAASFEDCVDWKDPDPSVDHWPTCKTSARVVVLDVSKAPSVTKLFDLSVPIDPTTGESDHLPGVEIAGDNNLLLSYQAVDPKAGASLDYRVLYRASTTSWIPWYATRVAHGVLGTTPKSGIKGDTAGIAVDPDAPSSVWFANEVSAPNGKGVSGGPIEFGAVTVP
jgi:hypothetical protein